MVSGAMHLSKTNFLAVILLRVFFQKCFAYDLDDLTYDKMPQLFTLDDYHRCLLYNGTYCLVKVNLHAEPSNELIHEIINYTKSSHIKHYNHTYLEKGVCVTKACSKFINNKDLNSNDDLKSVLEECTNAQISEEYGIQARVSKVYYCNKPKEPEPKDSIDWIILAGCLSVVLLNLSATVYDLIKPEGRSLSRGQTMLLCFSIIRNWNYLLSPATADPKMIKLQGINGMRVAASFVMVLGHVMWIYMMGFIDNPHDFERSYSIPHFQLLFNGMIIVQVFFVISGFLLVYNLEIASESHSVSWKTIPAIYINRLFRLAPSLSIMLAFTATWLRFMGSGPLWNRHVTPVVTDCRRWWWTHLLFINNYVKENKFCAIQTWHIAADTQLFFVGIIMYILTKKQHRNLLLGLMMLISFILPALHVYLQDLDAVLIKNPEFLRTLDNPNFNSAYVLGHNNISGFVLGMITAFKLHEWQKKGIVFKRPIYTFLFRISLPVFILFFFSGNLFYEEDFRTPLWVRMLYQATHRLICSLPLAYMIVALVMDFDTKYTGRLYNWSGFTFLGRLTYSVYLIHMNFISIITGTKTQLQHLSYLNMMVTQLGIVCLSYLISIPFYLMVEAPISPLVKLLLMSPKSKDSTETVPTKSFLTLIAKKKEGDEKEKMKKLLESSFEEERIGKQLEQSVKESGGKKIV